MNVVALPVVAGAIVWLLAARAGRPYRLLGWLSLTVVLIMLSRNTKPYYLSPLFTLLYAAGSLAAGRLLESPRRAPMLWIYTALVLGAGAVFAPLAKPLLSAERYLAHASRLGLAPRAEENHEMGRLPQFFADRIGWPELAQSVAGVVAALAPAERERACIFGQNYGQAGAIEYFGAELDLPPAIATHNSYHLWGPGDCSGEVVIVIDDDRESMEATFEAAELETTFRCRDCMPYENDKQIWVGRGLRRPIAEVWPRAKHYD
jgi:hypothetical protein